jgi:RHS repeat-associated protein
VGKTQRCTGPIHTVTNTWEPSRDVLDTKQNKVGTSVISNYDYAVNAIGQRTGVTTSGTAYPALPSWLWSYDTLGQVTSADSTVATSDRAYQYDAIGNRKKSADSLSLPPSDNYVATATNAYSSVQFPGAAAALTPGYDDDGNMTSGPLPVSPATNSTLLWDAENRLTEVKNAAGTALEKNVFDSGSQKIATIVNGITTLYLYDGWNCVAEYSGTTLTKTRLWGTDLSGSMQSAGGVGGLLVESQISNSQIPNFFPTYDGNGNISEYLDSTGQVTAHYEYDPFGNTVVNTDTANLFTYRFSTKPIGIATGLYYYGYRYYDPMTGRWPSRDPLAEESFFLEFTKFLDSDEVIMLHQESLLNVYSFSGNRQINEIDILGNYSCDTSFGSNSYEVGLLNASFNLRFDAWSLLQHKTNPAANPAAQVGWQPCNDGDTISDFEVTAKPSPGSGGEYLSSAKTLLYLNVETRYALIHSGSDAQAASEAKFCCKCEKK